MCIIEHINKGKIMNDVKEGVCIIGHIAIEVTAWYFIIAYAIRVF